MVLNIKSN